MCCCLALCCFVAGIFFCWLLLWVQFCKCIDVFNGVQHFSQRYLAAFSVARATAFATATAPAAAATGSTNVVAAIGANVDFGGGNDGQVKLWNILAKETCDSFMKAKKKKKKKETET